MLYTLLKFLGWGILLALIGGFVGWALRSLKCRGEVARARATTVDSEEVDRMRHRLANLEHVVAERDRLRMQVADLRHADSPGVVGAPVPAADLGDTSDAATDADGELDESDVGADADTVDAGVAADDGASVEDAETDVSDGSDDAPTGDTDAPSIMPEPTDGATEAEASTTVAGLAGDTVTETATDTADDADVPADEPSEPAATLDLDAAAAAIGKKIELDDLTVVEGIGPKIAELCSGIGVTTWRSLSDTEVGVLQLMLDDAGSRFQVHNPGSWPRQAGLLASGRWVEFKQLTDELDGGR